MNEPTAPIAWPKKTRELQHNHFDSAIWNDFRFRDDDIIIGTYGKSGTTWLQQIVGQLVFNGAEGVAVAELSPWVDMRLPPDTGKKMAAIEAQTHRRFLKTHLPADALVYSPKANYIYIARDGRDVVWSFYNHHANFNDLAYRELGAACPPGIEPFAPPKHEDVRDYFLEWLERDGYPLWSFWENIASWWAIRDLPNLLMLNYANLKSDMDGSIHRVAAFLDLDPDQLNWQDILEHCSFDYMKRNATLSAPLGGAIWEGGAGTFINKGINGRWRDSLTEEDNARYEAMAVEKLGADCAHWLKTGEM